MKDLSEFYTRYSDKVFRITRKYIKSKEKAEDATHDFFFKMMQEDDILNKPESYIMMAARNSAISYLRKDRILTSFITNSDYIDNYEDDIEEYDEEIFNARSEKVRAIVETLPYTPRIVFKLSIYDGEDNITIAKRLNITPNAVHSAKYRAIKIIKEEFNIDNYE